MKIELAVVRAALIKLGCPETKSLYALRGFAEWAFRAEFITETTLVKLIEEIELKAIEESK